jgi:hypothetical protein
LGRRVRALILAVALLGVGVFAGSALSERWVVPGSEAGAPAREGYAATGFPPTERVRVEVLNAGGRPNLAREVTELLRTDGFDVVFFGNAKEFGAQPSIVLDRVGRLDLARGVADALGIRSVQSEPDSNLFVDVSVRVGEEWTAPAPPAPPDPALAWWDPRRLLRRALAPVPPEQGATIADPGRRDR